jgi:gamma-glutamylcyclotransferase (GGCT)/AIG2-like uncharacterized protein YtfP
VNVGRKNDNQFLFAYGTLMRGFSNPFSKELTQNAVWRGKGSFPGQLFDLGSYPGAVYQSDATIHVQGEVWELTDFQKTISSLDHYEGIDDFNPEYTRREVAVELENGDTVLCWVYLFCQSIKSFRLIDHGNYRKWLSETEQHL